MTDPTPPDLDRRHRADCPSRVPQSHVEVDDQGGKFLVLEITVCLGCVDQVEAVESRTVDRLLGASGE